MTDNCFDTAIVGAGLSGLASAVLLSEAGRRVCVLEAREFSGGRVRSIIDEDTKKHIADLGPTWVWPNYQPVIASWIEKLGLKVFDQFDDGNAILDYGSDAAPEARFLPGQQGNMRVVGGSQALVDAMVNRLPEGTLFENTEVLKIETRNEDLVLLTSNKDRSIIRAQKVIIATPPRIAKNTISFQPILPRELKHALEMMPTWMAPHAKVSIVYDTAFWRDRGLSGRIASHAGPIVEAHDHCSADGSTAALWGFIGLPHDARLKMGDERLKFEVLSQLKRCFGKDMPEPVSITIEEWALDRFVTSQSDLIGPMSHPSVGPDNLREGHCDGRLFFAGAETAERSPGLIEGAFDSANRVSAQILHAE